MNLNLIINAKTKDKIQKIKEKVINELNEYLIKDLSFIIFDYCSSYDYYRIYIYARINKKRKILYFTYDQTNSLLTEDENYYCIKPLTPVTEETINISFDYEIQIYLYNWWNINANIYLEYKNSVIMVDNLIEIVSEDSMKFKYKFSTGDIDIQKFLIQYKNDGLIVWVCYHQSTTNLNRIFINKSLVSKNMK